MKNTSKIIVLLIVCFLLTSCYSIRVRSINGTPQPDPLSNRDDYYRNMEVVELDTVIKIGVTSKDFTYLIKETDKCKTGKLHTVEFRNTFGGSLLSMATFGKKRKMKIKYVCMKPAN
ncbi:hypothetical protein ACFSKN_18895 [Mariniflexile gromovii]|uniref:Lipoprotein n=1 Tax=Mariniflexile gromovii TaxID=362523 RepID=A0ABS4BUT1_9FLAO|nr:hypothetical protein [Mariniflexile gromovii]MBP0904349.1 hypothetical protein [Mariniflexile gromovii]